MWRHDDRGPSAWVVPKGQMADSVSRAADICMRFSWPPTSSNPVDVPEVGIITHAAFSRDRLRFANVRAVDKRGTLKKYSLPFSDDYGPAYSPIILAQVPEAGSGIKGSFPIRYFNVLSPN